LLRRFAALLRARERFLKRFLAVEKNRLLMEGLVWRRKEKNGHFEGD